MNSTNISAAGVYDLGYITWKHTKVKQCQKDNIVVNDALFNSFDDVMNMNIDFSELYTTMVDEVWGNDSLYTGGEYKTSLKTRLMLQGYFQLNKLARFTAIGQMYYLNNEYRPALTLAYSGSIFRLLNVTASYTMSEYSGNSIGAGTKSDMIGLRQENWNLCWRWLKLISFLAL